MAVVFDQMAVVAQVFLSTDLLVELEMMIYSVRSCKLHSIASWLPSHLYRIPAHQPEF